MSDPLSQILAILRPRSAISVGLDLAGDWSFQFPRHEGIKFNAVMRGACWLRLDGSENWERLEAGDCFLMTRGLPFQLASDPRLKPHDAAVIYRNAIGPVTPVNGGGELLLIGGRFSIAEGDGAPMLAALPPLFIVRRDSLHAEVLSFALARFADEVEGGQPGAALLAEHLAHIMLVHLLRIYLAEAPPEASGWLRALGDSRLRRALAAIHAEPARNWQLVELAQEAGMSRSSFAGAFKKAVGQSPMDYLAGWRMLLAKEQLRHGTGSIGDIAAAIGYRSEAAFSTAFKRLVGTSPRRARRDEGPSPVPSMRTSADHTPQ